MGKLAGAGRVLRDGWLLLGMVILLFCALEGGLSLLVRIKRGVSRSKPDVDWRIHADVYGDRSWVEEYYREFRASDAVFWRPYVYWRRGPYHGQYINVDTSGLRRTIPDRSQPGRSVRIFMFGGSALWGTGARDAFTIPSILARELQSRGLDAEVVNFGEAGYVSTQEVIALLLRLQKGDTPDLVIFYDGVNDVYSAYQQHAAGLPQNEFNRVKEFNLSADLPALRLPVFRDMANKLATVQVASSLLQRAGFRTQPEPRPPMGGGASGQDVGNAYSANLDLLRALSEHYNFKCLSYWQPTIFQKASLTRYERAEREKARTFEPFFREAYAAIGRSRLTQGHQPLVHDLSRMFADVPEPVFVDWVHLGESGNEVVARRMANDVMGLLAPAPAAPGAAPRTKRGVG